jgi:DNA topoisomerase-6 subunit A
MMRRTIPGTQIDVVEEQEESNKAVEDLELVTGFSREELNINANKNGSAAGKIIIKDKGDIIDWSKLGSGGWAIPSNTEDIEFKKVDAKFVIYMEKAAIWERLHEDRVWEKLNCIIISSQGQATRGIRRLLRRLNDEYKLPIYVLVDNDSWGYYIYSVLKHGSISLANVSEKLAVPSAKLIGLTCDDIEKYGLKKYLIKFQKVDESRLEQIRKYEWFQSKEWQKELKAMKDQKGKVELDALVAKGVTFISDVYLPEKLKNKEFLD